MLRCNIHNSTHCVDNDNGEPSQVFYYCYLFVRVCVLCSHSLGLPAGWYMIVHMIAGEAEVASSYQKVIKSHCLSSDEHPGSYVFVCLLKKMLFKSNMKTIHHNSLENLYFIAGLTLVVIMLYTVFKRMFMLSVFSHPLTPVTPQLQSLMSCRLRRSLWPPKTFHSSLLSTVLQDMQRGVEECVRVCVCLWLWRGGCMLSSYPHCSGIELQQLEDCKLPDNAAIFRLPVLILLLSWWWRESHEF